MQDAPVYAVTALRTRPHVTGSFAGAARELLHASRGLRGFVVLEVWTAVQVRYVRVA